MARNRIRMCRKGLSLSVCLSDCLFLLPCACSCGMFWTQQSLSLFLFIVCHFGKPAKSLSGKGQKEREGGREVGSVGEGFERVLCVEEEEAGKTSRRNARRVVQ